MSYKILKSIEFELSSKSIGNAIREVRRFRDGLRETCLELVEALMNEGIDIAKMQVASMEAVYTGELENGISGFFSRSRRCGFVYTNTYYAIYVEYGTGIIGEESPHPEAWETGWNYDINGHGEQGWVYKNDRDGKFHWTQGYVSRPFMYNTLKWLEEAAPEMASRFFHQM